jgi:subtilisin family serine protease
VRAVALLSLLTLAWVLPSTASSGLSRIAVGVVDGTPVEQVAELVERATGRPVDRTLGAIGAVVVPVEDLRGSLPVLEALPGVEYTEPIGPTRRLAFVPNDPLAESAQWYLPAIRAFDQWPSKPNFGQEVTVAVIDSGIDASHPDLDGRIAAGRSFVDARWDVDTMGHGTFVAGEIAAHVDNGVGIAGVGIPARLLVAKVTNDKGLITVEAEAEAIKWAVDQGARVINLSLTGVRDPRDPTNDEYSAVEQDAIEYAYSNGSVVVAASGNCDIAPTCPWAYAGYPAALPHVIGVGALQSDNSVAEFSNRDPVYVDVVAPGRGIVSTWPRPLSDTGCPQVGYSVCALASGDRNGDGTSFAAPLVSAAIALLLAENPSLAPNQVTALVEASAARHDLGASGRDAGTGAGSLDVVELLGTASQSLPPRDQFETNDDAGERARRIPLRASRSFKATIDYYDDPSDVYRVYLRRGKWVTVTLTGALGGSSTLVLWSPGTEHVSEVTNVAVRSGAITAWRKGARPALKLTIPRSGWYFVEVKAPGGGGGEYLLSLEQARAANGR